MPLPLEECHAQEKSFGEGEDGGMRPARQENFGALAACGRPARVLEEVSSDLTRLLAE